MRNLTPTRVKISQHLKSVTLKAPFNTLIKQKVKVEIKIKFEQVCFFLLYTVSLIKR